MWHKGELVCFASIAWDQPYLRFVFALFLLFLLIFVRWLALAFTVGYEGQPAPVRRPAWAMRVDYAACKAPGFAACGWCYPDRGAVFILALVDGCDDEGHALAI